MNFRVAVLSNVVVFVTQVLRPGDACGSPLTEMRAYIWRSYLPN